MSISVKNISRIINMRVAEDSLVVDVANGRTISVPLAWYPRLLHGRPAERNYWRLIGNGEGIHWPDLDEDISVVNLLLGQPPMRANVRSRGGWRRGRDREYRGVL